MTMLAKLLRSGSLVHSVTTRTPPLECRWEDNQHARLTVRAAATGTPVGVFTVEMSDDPRVQNDIANGVASTANETAEWQPVTLPAGSVHVGSGGAVSFSGPSTDIAFDGTAAANFMINMDQTPAWVRLVYTSSSGGTGNTSLEVDGGVS